MKEKRLKGKGGGGGAKLVLLLAFLQCSREVAGPGDNGCRVP